MLAKCGGAHSPVLLVVDGEDDPWVESLLFEGRQQRELLLASQFLHHLLGHLGGSHHFPGRPWSPDRGRIFPSDWAESLRFLITKSLPKCTPQKWQLKPTLTTVITIEFCVLQNEYPTFFTEKNLLYFILIENSPQSCDPVKTQSLRRDQSGNKLQPKKFSSSLNGGSLFKK